ncbi:MAG: glycogen debranching protein, partial [Sphingobacteriia bacterium]|nr:glycogen debranching protein [Sphingobacteriia bacterium]
PAPRTSLQRLARREQALLRIARVHLAALAPLPTWIEQLILAADSFIIERAIAASSAPATPVMGRSVIAGYPWFGDWGRDTMIALPGLTLMTGRHRLARRILETYAGFVDRGMLPNRLPERGEPPEYHAVDAALWFIEAWRAYMHTTWDWAALARVFPVLESIIAHYRAGTRHGIVMDPADGLISAGAPGLQLTWMDAKVEDWVVTPRIGKPVEVNALWYQGLRSMADFAMYVNQDPLPYRRQAEHTLRGFARFVRADGQGLHDVLDGPNGDESRIRPNQLLAVSLSHSPIAPSTCAAVVEVCARHLLCSHGLRSLAPLDPDYQGVYAGDVRRRDGAYHQGTVWAWLLGHHALAEYRVSGDAARAQRLLEPLADQLWDAGVGSLGEIFDGDPPHRPRGCPAQAWSVACVLEAWVRLERARRGG